MKKATFDDLLASMNEALEHAEGKRTLRTTTLPRPPAPPTARGIDRLTTAVS